MKFEPDKQLTLETRIGLWANLIQNWNQFKSFQKASGLFIQDMKVELALTNPETKETAIFGIALGKLVAGDKSSLLESMSQSSIKRGAHQIVNLLTSVMGDVQNLHNLGLTELVRKYAPDSHLRDLPGMTIQIDSTVEASTDLKLDDSTVETEHEYKDSMGHARAVIRSKARQAKREANEAFTKAQFDLSQAFEQCNLAIVEQMERELSELVNVDKVDLVDDSTVETYGPVDLQRVPATSELNANLTNEPDHQIDNSVEQSEQSESVASSNDKPLSVEPPPITWLGLKIISSVTKAFDEYKLAKNKKERKLRGNSLVQELYDSGATRLQVVRVIHALEDHVKAFRKGDQSVELKAVGEVIQSVLSQIVALTRVSGIKSPGEELVCHQCQDKIKSKSRQNQDETENPVDTGNDCNLPSSFTSKSMIIDLIKGNIIDPEIKQRAINTLIMDYRAQKEIYEILKSEPITGFGDNAFPPFKPGEYEEFKNEALRNYNDVDLKCPRCAQPTIEIVQGEKFGKLVRRKARCINSGCVDMYVSKPLTEFHN